jgi:hypothetical protein
MKLVVENFGRVECTRYLISSNRQCPTQLWHDEIPNSSKTSVEVEVKLRPTLSWPVSLDAGHPSGTRDQFYFLLEIFFRHFRVCYFVAPSPTRGQVCNLLYNCFWALPEKSLLGRSPAELTAIFYCLIWDSTNLEGQIPVLYPPGTNRVAQLYPQALGSLLVASTVDILTDPRKMMHWEISGFVPCSSVVTAELASVCRVEAQASISCGTCLIRFTWERGIKESANRQKVIPRSTTMCHVILQSDQETLWARNNNIHRLNHTVLGT